MKVLPVRNLGVESFSYFEIKIAHLSGIKFAQKFREQRNNFFLFRDQIFKNWIWYATDSVLIVALELEQEAIELFCI